MEFNTKSIFVAMVGKPNVGKSSLMNLILGEKIAIVTQKPQTTRTSITGILTKGATQFVFMDTPGIHTPRTKLGERMVKTSHKTIADVDLAVMIFEPYGDLNEAELSLVDSIKKNRIPAIAVINKKDTLKKAADLDVQVKKLEEIGVFDKVVATSAKDNDGVDELLNVIDSYAMEGPHYFEEDAITNMPEKVIVSEIVREKLLLNLFEEIPHGTNVEVEKFKERKGKNMVDISVVIYCERKSHKGMIIGKQGAMLKKISSQARADIEQFLGAKVFMECWVKVKEDWRDSNYILNDFGFKDE
ncbi:MAG: GTPase Era [Oscillospiraceae bacterium]|nr:GTPase Era [Oscillospiraceae bacterium]MBQ5312883.1 GTPase Era [Oscillospiraceae bacterium]